MEGLGRREERGRKGERGFRFGFVEARNFVNADIAINLNRRGVVRSRLLKIFSYN